MDAVRPPKPGDSDEYDGLLVRVHMEGVESLLVESLLVELTASKCR